MSDDKLLLVKDLTTPSPPPRRPHRSGPRSFDLDRNETLGIVGNRDRQDLLSRTIMGLQRG